MADDSINVMNLFLLWNSFLESWLPHGHLWRMHCTMIYTYIPCSLLTLAYFSSLDLMSGYHQFIQNQRWRVLSPGLTNPPATCQTEMNEYLLTCQQSW